MSAIVTFTKVGCPYSARAKMMLEEKGMPFVNISLDDDIRHEVLKALTGNSITSPQVFIDGKLIGGCEDLMAYLGEE